MPSILEKVLPRKQPAPPPPPAPESFEAKQFRERHGSALADKDYASLVRDTAAHRDAHDKHAADLTAAQVELATHSAKKADLLLAGDNAALDQHEAEEKQLDRRVAIAQASFNAADEGWRRHRAALADRDQVKAAENERRFLAELELSVMGGADEIIQEFQGLSVKLFKLFELAEQSFKIGDGRHGNEFGYRLIVKLNEGCNLGMLLANQGWTAPRTSSGSLRQFSAVLQALTPPADWKAKS